MADVTDFGDYSVKAVKSFEGHDGYGFNCNLYRGKKKIATCHDGAYGGEVEIHWEGKEINGEYVSCYKEEEPLLQAHCNSLPEVKYGEGLTGSFKVDQSFFVTELVTKWERDKDVRKMQKQCQTKTLFRQPNAKLGSYQIFNAPLSDRLREHIKAKYGECEIFNDVLEKGEVPSVLLGN